MSKGKIIFLHPDLGVGGAERLVVDAALALKRKDFDVKFVTAHHDVNHCFKETKDGSIEVITVGTCIPRDIFGRFFALMAVLRMIVCAFHIIFFEKADIVFCDLVSIPVPLLRLFSKKVIFYCHFPDQLLSKPEGILKKIYRLPLDFLEEVTTCLANKIYVNSKFTQGVFKETFDTFSSMSWVPEPNILYPSLNTAFFDDFQNVESDFINSIIKPESFVFLSINRYERKKNVELSIKALKELQNLLPEDEWEKIILVIAGGYDDRVQENISYYNELKEHAVASELSEKIIFLKSPSDIHKVALLKRCDALIYTPSNEHFGIVPLEAMYCKKPVIAVNSGGPTETIVDGETGFLCEPEPEHFAARMCDLVNNPHLGITLGKAGQERFNQTFSFQAFSDQLNSDIHCLLGISKDL